MNRSMKSYAGLSELALKNVVALADMEEPDPGENGEDEEKFRERLDYTHTQDVVIKDILFRCTTIGVECEGIGTIDCLEWAMTECKRI
jgi:hypothetical protein